MLTGTQLGDAIRAAVDKKVALGVTKRAIAEHFQIKPPSLQDWMKRGTVRKDRLGDLFEYFADVVGPAHWGMAAFPQRQVSLYALSQAGSVREPSGATYDDSRIGEIVTLLASVSDAGLDAALAAVKGIAAAMPRTHKQNGLVICLKDWRAQNLADNCMRVN